MGAVIPLRLGRCWGAKLVGLLLLTNCDPRLDVAKKVVGGGWVGGGASPYIPSVDHVRALDTEILPDQLFDVGGEVVSAPGGFATKEDVSISPIGRMSGLKRPYRSMQLGT